MCGVVYMTVFVRISSVRYRYANFGDGGGVWHLVPIHRLDDGESDRVSVSALGEGRSQRGLVARFEPDLEEGDEHRSESLSEIVPGSLICPRSMKRGEVYFVLCVRCSDRPSQLHPTLCARYHVLEM